MNPGDDHPVRGVVGLHVVLNVGLADSLNVLHLILGRATPFKKYILV